MNQGYQCLVGSGDPQFSKYLAKFTNQPPRESELPPGDDTIAHSDGHHNGGLQCHYTMPARIGQQPGMRAE